MYGWANNITKVGLALAVGFWWTRPARSASVVPLNECWTRTRRHVRAGSNAIYYTYPIISKAACSARRSSTNRFIALLQHRQQTCLPWLMIGQALAAMDWAVLPIVSMGGRWVSRYRGNITSIILSASDQNLLRLLHSTSRRPCRQTTGVEWKTVLRPLSVVALVMAYKLPTGLLSSKGSP